MTNMGVGLLGHDRRYAMDITAIRRDIGWTPQWNIDQGLRMTIQWYLSNAAWWQRVANEAYKAANDLYLAKSGRQGSLR